MADISDLQGEKLDRMLFSGGGHDLDHLTDKEIDGLVERVVMGNRGRFVDQIKINGEWREGETWLSEGEDPDDPPAGARVGMHPPRYSTNLSTAWRLIEKLGRSDTTAGYIFRGTVSTSRWFRMTEPELARRICYAAILAMRQEYLNGVL